MNWIIGLTAGYLCGEALLYAREDEMIKATLSLLFGIALLFCLP